MGGEGDTQITIGVEGSTEPKGVGDQGGGIPGRWKKRPANQGKFNPKYSSSHIKAPGGGRPTEGKGRACC